MKKYFCVILVLISLQFTYADSEVQTVQSQINAIRDADPDLPSSGTMNQRGVIGIVISSIFDTTWKIKTKFLSVFDWLTSDRVPRYTGTDFVDGTIRDTGTRIGVWGAVNNSYIANFTGNVRIWGTIVANPPTAGNHLATKTYVDDKVAAGSWGTVTPSNVWDNSRPDGKIFYNAANVGIWISNPATKLEVDGEIRINPSGWNNSIFTMRSDADTSLTIEADTDNIDETHNPEIEFKQDGWWITARLWFIEWENDFWIANRHTSDLVLGTSNTWRLRIKANGDIGIGDSTPSARLDVNAEWADASVMRFGTERPWWIYQRNTWANSELDLHSENDGKSFTITSPTGNEVARFRPQDTPSSSEINFVENGGRVWIGTLNPSETLEVNGNTRVTWNVISSPAPTASNHLANKAYVDSKTSQEWAWNYNSSWQYAYIVWNNIDARLYTYINGWCSWCTSDYETFTSRWSWPTNALPVQNGDKLWWYRFRGWDGDEFRITAGIFAHVNDVVSNNNIPTRLWFYTDSFNGDSNGTERMSIISNGNVWIGVIDPSEKLEVDGDILANNLESTSQNTRVWRRTLEWLTTWEKNVAVWYKWLIINSSWTDNTAIWDNTLTHNTIWSYNTAIGSYSLEANVDWNRNTWVWTASLHDVTNWNNNTAMWDLALLRLSTWNNNTALGQWAGDGITTWSRNIVIWRNVQVSNNLWNNQLSIWNLIYGTGLDAEGSTISSWNIGIWVKTPNYKLHVNGSAGKPGWGSWTNSSDMRLKNIQWNYEYGLDEIIKLNPVRFEYKKNNARDLESGTREIGFIAQEVEKVIPDAVSKWEDGFLDFNMHSINVALVNAVKELKTLFEDDSKQKDNEIQELREQLQKLQKQVDNMSK